MVTKNIIQYITERSCGQYPEEPILRGVGAVAEATAPYQKDNVIVQINNKPFFTTYRLSLMKYDVNPKGTNGLRNGTNGKLFYKNKKQPVL